MASGMVWVRPGKLPANVIVAPNSPSARAHASTAPAMSPGRIAGNVTRRNTYHREAPEGPRRVLVASVELAERGLDRDHEERHRHEGLGDDHARGRERQRDAEPPVEVLADETAATERVEEGDAGDDRRQHHRERAQRSRRAPPWERRPGPAATRAGRRTGSRTTVAQIEHHSDSRSAVNELCDVRIDQTSPHGAFHSRPRNGSAKKHDRGDREDEDREREALVADPPAGRRLGRPAP